MTLWILGVEILDQTVVAHNVITAAGTDGCNRCFMTHDADWRGRGRGGGGCMIHGERASADGGLRLGGVLGTQSTVHIFHETEKRNDRYDNHGDESVFGTVA